MKGFLHAATGVLIVSAIGVSFSPFVFAQEQSSAITALTDAKSQLEQQIQTKAKDLDAITRQIEDTRKNLNQVQGQKSSLQKELKVLQGNITDINLNIRADQTNIEKLNLEIRSLEGDISDIGRSIRDKQAAISQILASLQKNGQDSMFLTFLRNKTLADGVTEANDMARLQTQLSADIAQMQQLNVVYKEKVDTAQNKHEKVKEHAETLKDRKIIVEDQKQERQQILSETKNREDAYQKQMSELQKRQQQIAAEIEDIDAKLRAQINPNALPTSRPGVLGLPTDLGLGRVTQGYGATAFAQRTYASRRHNGIDFGVSIGTPVYASESGTVAASGNQDAYCPRGAYGKFVVINHDNNLTTLYAHLSRYIVSAGDRVTRGQIIGYSGNTGASTGPHIHFTVYARDTFRMSGSRTCGPMPQGGDLNPLNYL